MIDSSDAARHLAKLPRKAHEQTCSVCGQPFQTVGRRLYCSRACQMKAFRAKRKSAQNHEGESLAQVR